jgi:hypothetical protein
MKIPVGFPLKMETVHNHFCIGKNVVYGRSEMACHVHYDRLKALLSLF